jgi:hypothetical protein
MSVSTQLDHLVVVASDLAQGVAWCEATLGVTPGPGGEHALFGTHNRLFNISTPQWPQVYFEIIAINKIATRADSMPARRWFDIDNNVLQGVVTYEPRLLHFVARTPNAQTACAALHAQDIDRGDVLAASRMTPQGLLEWQITVREDGQRLFSGALPTLIQWGASHPVQSMNASGVTLQSLHVAHPHATRLQVAYEAIGLQGIACESGAANVRAVLQTPKGLVTLESKGI